MKSINYLVFLLPIISYSQVGINTDNPRSTLDVNGELTIREVYPLKGQTINNLYINENGLIGTNSNTSNITSKIFNAIGNQTNIVNSPTILNSFNNGYVQNIAIENNFFVLNKLGIQSNRNNLLFKEDGTYLINVAINFNFTSANNGEVYILGAIQTKKPLDSNWNTISGSRIIVSDEGYNQLSKSMVFPMQINEIVKDTELRIIFYRDSSQSYAKGDGLSFLEIASVAEKNLYLDGLNIIIQKL